MSTRHRWAHTVPHHAVCDRCKCQRRQVWYPGGKGASAYYDARGVYTGSRAPECRELEQPKVAEAYPRCTCGMIVDLFGLHDHDCPEYDHGEDKKTA